MSKNRIYLRIVIYSVTNRVQANKKPYNKSEFPRGFSKRTSWAETWEALEVGDWLIAFECMSLVLLEGFCAQPVVGMIWFLRMARFKVNYQYVTE